MLYSSCASVCWAVPVGKNTLTVAYDMSHSKYGTQYYIKTGDVYNPKHTVHLKWETNNE